jgi:hypothetical protein
MMLLRRYLFYKSTTEIIRFRIKELSGISIITYGRWGIRFRSYNRIRGILDATTCSVSRYSNLNKSPR